mgnify:CR=1 FL=1
MKSPAPTITLLCLLFLASCITRNKTSLEAFNQDVYTPEYASGFKILGAENDCQYTYTDYQPVARRQRRNNVLFVTRNGEQAPAGFNGPVIPAGAKQIVCMSSSYVAMLDELGEVNRIVGVSGMIISPIPTSLPTKIQSRIWVLK